MSVSARGLQDSGVGPLRKFYGDVMSLSDPPEERKSNDGRAYSVVVFRMNQVEFQQSTEPYVLPVAEIAISLSNKKKSSWGFFSDSLLKFLTPEEDVPNRVSRRVGWVYCDGADGRPQPKTKWNRDQQKEVPAPAWEVFDVVGAVVAGATDPVEELKKALDGKTEAEFNKVVFGLDVVKKSPDIQRQLTDHSFVTALVQMGVFVKDSNGIYHRK